MALALAWGCADATEVDPEARLRAILEIPFAVDRAVALGELLGSLGPEDLPAVARAIEPTRGRIDEVSAALIASWWVGIDPEGARAEGAPRRGRPALWDRTVLREWAWRDPHSVRGLVAEIPGEDRERLLDAVRALVGGWFRTDAAPDELLALIEPLPLGRTRNEAIDSFVHAMLRRDGVEQTIAFVEDLPTGGIANFKLQFFRRLATAIAQRDPRRAVAWAQQHAGGPYGANLLRRIGARWGWVEGEPAMEWAVALPDGPQRADIVRETYRGFRMRARERADAWMREQTPSAVLEPAYVLYLVGLSDEDPRTALTLARHIADPQLRAQVVVPAARRWLETEPEAARAWLAEANLSEELRGKLLPSG